MNESEFRRLVHCGMGRAILYARDHDVRAFHDVILDACLHCYSVDAQCEGTRAVFTLELLDVLPDKEFYKDEVLKALPGSGDGWDAVHRFWIAMNMALDGDERARHVLYESFNPGPSMGETIACCFVQLDGLKWLLFAAEKIGSLLLADAGDVDIGWLLSHAIETCGEQETLTALREAGAQNPRIEVYRSVAEAHWSKPSDYQQKRQDMAALDYEQLQPRLRELDRFWLSQWGKLTDSENLKRAAHGLIASRNPQDQLLHLRIFYQRPLPLDPLPLIRLVDSGNEKVALAAAAALGRVTHPDVRDLAFRLVDTGAAGRAEAIAMLIRNFQAGDHEIALGWFEREVDREVQHGLGMDLRNLWDEHPDATTEVCMLRSMYEKGPCSCCREFVVGRLIELNALTADLRAECAFDANEDTRELVAAKPAEE